MEQNSIDARGARLALRMYLKWSWVAVVALVAGFFVGSSLSSSAEIEGESTLVVGLTDEVRWPFFDAVLARQQGLIEDFDLAAKTTEATGIEHTSVTVQAENTQNSTLTIAVVVDGSADDAAAFANELGDQLVRANADAQAASYVEEAQSLQDQLAEQKLLEVGYETDIADLTAEWVAIQDEIVVAEVEDIAELRGEALVADRARRVAERRLDGVIAFESSLTAQLAQAEREAANSASTVEVSRSAAAVSGSATDLGPVLAILNFLLALLLIPFLERGFGRVGSVDQLALFFPGAKLIDARFDDAGAVQPIDVVALSVKSLEARRHGALPETQYPPLVVAETGLSKATDEILTAVSVGGRRVSLADLETPAGLDSAVDADQVVLVVPARSMRVGRAKDLASALVLLDAAPEVVVLSKKASRDTEPRVYSAFPAATAAVSTSDSSDSSRSTESTDVNRPLTETQDRVVPPPSRRRAMVSAQDVGDRSAVSQEPAEDESLSSLLGEAEGADGDASTTSDGAGSGTAATERRARRASRRTAAQAAAPEPEKSSESKSAAAKVDAAKADAAKADAVKSSESKSAAAKVDAAKADAAKADAVKSSESKSAAAKTAAAKAEASKSDKSKPAASAATKTAAAESSKTTSSATKSKPGQAKTDKTEPRMPTAPKRKAATSSSVENGQRKDDKKPASVPPSKAVRPVRAEDRSNTQRDASSSDKSDAKKTTDAKPSRTPSPSSSTKRRPRLPVKDTPKADATGEESKTTDDKTPAGSS